MSVSAKILKRSSSTLTVQRPSLASVAQTGLENWLKVVR